MTAIIAATVFGPMLVPPYDVYLSQALIRMGQYAPEEFATWRPYLHEGATVIDAGANIGAHTMAFAAAVGLRGLVYAVEPQRMLYYMLCGSIALIGARHVVARHCALGREAGEVRVPPLDYAAQNNFGGLELRGVKDGESVPCLPLDSWQLTTVDFLKIDVEGMELDVLHGAKDTISRCRPVLAVEADREQNVPAMLAWLRLNGYRVWWHRPPLGPLWPGVVSVNFLALPRERTGLPDPVGNVEVAVA